MQTASKNHTAKENGSCFTFELPYELPYAKYEGCLNYHIHRLYSVRLAVAHENVVEIQREPLEQNMTIDHCAL